VNLVELQHYFAHAATSGSGPLPDLDRVFKGSERLSAGERLAIYNRSYFYRLLDALACVFTHTKRLLGETDFERLGLAYIAQTPSIHPAVERFGRAFPEYLRLVAAPPLIVDLAALEWARLCALVARNAAHIASAREVETSRFPQARLRFVPSLQWLELDPGALHAFADGVRSSADLANARCGVAIWRADHAVRHEVLDSTEWQALLCATSGASLNRVCAVFDTGSADDDVQRAFQVLARWFARRWLESVVYDEAEQPTPR
jgi:hypothetical protein